MRRKGKKERKEKFVSIASQINIGHLFLVLSIKQSYIQVESCNNKRLTICRICVIIDLLRPAKSTHYFFGAMIFSWMNFDNTFMDKPRAMNNANQSRHNLNSYALFFLFLHKLTAHSSLRRCWLSLSFKIQFQVLLFLNKNNPLSSFCMHAIQFSKIRIFNCVTKWVSKRENNW